MRHAMVLRDLASVSNAELERRARDAAKVKPNGALVRIGEQIAELERKHGMSTAEMRHLLAEGDLPETSEIGHWLILSKTRETVAGR